MTAIDTHDRRQPTNPPRADASAAKRAPTANSGAGARKAVRKLGKKGLVTGVAIAVLALLAGYELLLGRGHPTPTKAVPGPVVVLPQTTINLADGHLLQVTLAVLVQEGVLGKSQATLPARDLAPMENDAITVFSQFSEATLLSGAGKAQAKAELLADFRGVVGAGPVGPAVMAVYFTELVMQ